LKIADIYVFDNGRHPWGRTKAMLWSYYRRRRTQEQLHSFCRITAF